ncbi:hypothetical protein QUN99_003401 [Vibrio parahaemolyticus]|nr:hypothetical protein [Vibrio parahaemolyticus]
MKNIDMSHPVSQLELNRMQRCYEATYDNELVSQAFHELIEQIERIQVGHMMLMSDLLTGKSTIPIALWCKDFSQSPVNA